MLLGKENGSDEMTPLYHLMDPKVNKENGYSKNHSFLNFFLSLHKINGVQETVEITPAELDTANTVERIIL